MQSNSTQPILQQGDTAIWSPPEHRCFVWNYQDGVLQKRSPATQKCVGGGDYQYTTTRKRSPATREVFALALSHVMVSITCSAGWAAKSSSKLGRNRKTPSLTSSRYVSSRDLDPLFSFWFSFRAPSRPQSDWLGSFRPQAPSPKRTDLLIFFVEFPKGTADLFVFPGYVSKCAVSS